MYMKDILNAGQSIKHCDIKAIKEQVPQETGVLGTKPKMTHHQLPSFLWICGNTVFKSAPAVRSIRFSAQFSNLWIFSTEYFPPWVTWRAWLQTVWVGLRFEKKEEIKHSMSQVTVAREYHWQEIWPNLPEMCWDQYIKGSFRQRLCVENSLLNISNVDFLQDALQPLSPLSVNYTQFDFRCVQMRNKIKSFKRAMKRQIFVNFTSLFQVYKEIPLL